MTSFQNNLAMSTALLDPAIDGTLNRTPPLQDPVRGAISGLISNAAVTAGVTFAIPYVLSPVLKDASPEFNTLGNVTRIAAIAAMGAYGAFKGAMDAKELNDQYNIVQNTALRIRDDSVDLAKNNVALSMQNQELQAGAQQLYDTAVSQDAIIREQQQFIQQMVPVSASMAPAGDWTQKFGGSERQQQTQQPFAYQHPSKTGHNKVEQVDASRIEGELVDTVHYR